MFVTNVTNLNNLTYGETMARPKTYSDQDIIETAMQLVQQKKEVKAWRIREILGRGKLTSIQSDLDRLIADNEINILLN